MSVAAMVKQPPPTPPSADGRQLQDGVGHLVQHNARSEHQANTYALDNSPYMPSGATSFDNTPEPEMGQWYVDQFGNRSFHLYQEQSNLGLDMNFVSCTKTLAGRKTDEANKLMRSRIRMDHKPSILSNRLCSTTMLSSSST